MYDDRDESAGVKFTDVDLLGMPLRITVSPKCLAAGGIEFCDRGTRETEVLPLATAAVRLGGL